MKMLILIIALTCINPAFGVVWENDPSFTPEQREQAKQTNERIRQRNSKQEAVMHEEIAKATQRFIDEIESIRAKYPPIVG